MFCSADWLTEKLADLLGSLKILRPLVEPNQNLPLGAPQILNPQTSWGISLLNTVLWGLYRTSAYKLFGGFGGATSAGKDWILPDYAWVGLWAVGSYSKRLVAPGSSEADKIENPKTGIWPSRREILVGIWSIRLARCAGFVQTYIDGNSNTHF